MLLRATHLPQSLGNLRQSANSPACWLRAAEAGLLRFQIHAWGLFNSKIADPAKPSISR